MRMLPGMTVIVPCDHNQTKQATLAIAQHEGPVYLRFGRPKWPVFIPVDMPFEIGKAQVLIEGNDVSSSPAATWCGKRIAGGGGTGEARHPAPK
jgi:transketolase